MELNDINNRLKGVINNVIKFTNEGSDNNRSGDRTKILHEGSMETYLDSKGLLGNNKIKLTYEEPLPCFYGKTISADAVLRVDGKIKAVFLYKLYNTSVLKNVFNYESNKVGDVFRLCGTVEYETNPFDIVFITFAPTKTYIVSGKNENAKFKFEDVFSKYDNIRCLTEHPLFKNLGGEIHNVKIFFTPNDDFFKSIEENKRDNVFNLCENGYISDIDCSGFEALPQYK